MDYALTLYYQALLESAQFLYHGVGSVAVTLLGFAVAWRIALSSRDYSSAGAQLKRLPVQIDAACQTFFWVFVWHLLVLTPYHRYQVVKTDVNVANLAADQYRSALEYERHSLQPPAVDVQQFGVEISAVGHWSVSALDKNNSGYGAIVELDQGKLHVTLINPRGRDRSDQARTVMITK